MRIRLALAALMICVPTLGRPLAETQTPAAPALDAGSMRFAWVKEGPAEVCGEHCREWISASGPITGDTVRDFQFFSEARDPRGATIVLDSGGGAVLASLDLGRKLREFGMKTTVGRTVTLPPDPNGEQRAKLSPRGECASMCVFALLGGVHRTVPPEARILVHQIWPGSKRYDATAENYTAEELVRIQRDVGRIARYTVEMGGDIELFELAMRIPPWERLRSLTQSELRRLRLQMLETAAEAPTSGALTVQRRPRIARGSAPERGWALVEAASNQALARRHALTTEGEEIGQFELSFSCGTPDGSFKVAYLDQRAMSSGDADRLRDVTLWLGGERVALTVESSAPRNDNSELYSVASGAVTAAFVDKLRNDATSVIVVGTKTTDNVRTSIRVGGTGFARAFPQLADGCGK